MGASGSKQARAQTSEVPCLVVGSTLGAPVNSLTSRAYPMISGKPYFPSFATVLMKMVSHWGFQHETIQAFKGTARSRPGSDGFVAEATQWACPVCTTRLFIFYQPRTLSISLHKEEPLWS